MGMAEGWRPELRRRGVICLGLIGLILGIGAIPFYSSSKKIDLIQISRNSSKNTVGPKAEAKFGSFGNASPVSSSSSLESLEKQYRLVQCIQMKPFQSRQERQQLEESLSNISLIQRTMELLRSSDGFFESKGQGKIQSTRLEAIGFLAETLGWEENPLRAEILDQLEDLVFENPQGLELSSDKKKSWVGDKIELYSLIIQSDPDRAEQMMERAHGTMFERVLRFSFEYTRALRAQKASLPDVRNERIDG
jgi:hypothetical protein